MQHSNHSSKKGHIDLLITLLSAGCIFGVLFGAIIASCAAFIRSRIVAYALLLDDYDSLYVWCTLILAGTSTVVLNVYTFYIASDLDARRGWSAKVLLGHAVGTLATFAAAGVIAQHVSEVTSSYSGGIRNAMQKYNASADLKRQLDTMQIRFACCGAYNFSDWFAVQWINSAWDIGNDPRILRPCITHRVAQLEHHQRYERAGETLNADGCVAALERYFGKRLLFRVACGVAAIGVFQACIGALFFTITRRAHKLSAEAAYVEVDQNNGEN